VVLDSLLEAYVAVGAVVGIGEAVVAVAGVEDEDRSQMPSEHSHLKKMKTKTL
jgi:hypothetical protein